MGSPAVEPDNPFTRIIHKVGAANAAAGKLVGRGYAPTVHGDTMPNARSAAVGQPSPVTPPPPTITPEEQAYKDQRARELGILPPDELGGPKATVDMDAVEAALRSPGQAYAEMNKPVMVPVSRMPNFSNIERIDLVKSVLVVDGLEFPLTATELSDARTWAMAKVIEAVQAQIRGAMELMGAGTAPKEIDGQLGGPQPGAAESNETQHTEGPAVWADDEGNRTGSPL